MIIDLDHTEDWDDAMDLKTAALFHRTGLINLIAVGGCTSSTMLPAALQGSLAYYGITNVPIGTWKGATYNQTYDAYNPTIASDQGISATASSYPDAVTVYRQQLAAAPANSVILISTGPLHQIKALLDSPADAISPLAGTDLVAAKVSSFIPVAGIFPSGSEYNVTQKPSEAASVLNNWPSTVPIVFAGIELAGVNVGTGVICGAGNVLGSLPATEPCRRARDLWNANVTGYPAGTGRNAWALFALWHIVVGAKDLEITRGTASINATTGANSWSPSSTGNHYYLSKLQNDSYYIGVFDDILDTALTTSPIVNYTTPSSAIAADVASDTFNRANSTTTLGTSSGGQTWTAHSGTWGIVSNAAYCAVRSGDSVASFNSTITEVDVAATLTIAASGSSQPGLVWRAIDQNNYWLAMVAENGQSTLWKRVAGNYTFFGAFTGSDIGNNKSVRVRVRAIGNVHRIYINGRIALTTTDAALNTATRVGIRVNDASACRWDDLSVKTI